MRKLYWYITAYVKKHGLLLAFSVVIALVLFSFSISLIVQRLETKQKRYIGVIGEYSLHTLPKSIQTKLSAGLTKLEPDDTVSPLLAERWTIEDSGKTYRFVVKKDIFWQDGKEVVPGDIQYNFSDVEIITTPNDIVFKLPDEFVPFPSVVAQPVFRIVEEPYLLFFTRPSLVGIGEYELEDYIRDGNKIKQVVLDGPEERLVYRFYLTEDDAVLAFKRGEVDELSDLAATHGLDTWPNTIIEQKLRTDRYLAVFFNNSFPLLNKNVRQALSYAMSKPSGTEKAIGPINPLSWAYLEGGKSYDKDLERAKERLLDELPPEPLNLELTTTEIFVKQAEVIKQEWEEFGKQAVEACQNSKDIDNKDLCQNAAIAITIRVTNFPDTSNFQMLLIGQEIPPDPDQYGLWHSEQSTNFSHYKNTRIDALLEKGRTTPEKNERKAIYQEFQQFFLEDAPAIFIRHLESYDIWRK